ncbi:hypothetical protein [Kribbella deserti]|uniref:Neutral/alkaline non-lysosomal ceramidase N-terminal domain-containing protein n=1 Tax=Kribbella deserti TaxID=1926257 RepID=A0ABV6QS46_9ACTN
MTLLLAAASLDVTPPPGHPMDGYAGRSDPATGTADPLLATIVWLGTADDPGVLWLSLDAVAVSAELTAELAAAAGVAAGIPADRVLVCASHTHSGPTGWSGTIHPVLPAEHDPALAGALVSAVESCRLNRRPVTASWHSARVDGLGTNRHRVDGPHDATAGILAFDDLNGSRAAVLLDFACHPTVHGPEHLRWSADWPGAARDRLAVPVVGFLQGSAGDISTRYTRTGRGAAEVSRLGGLLAQVVTRALAGEGQPLPAVAPRVRRTRIAVARRRLPPVDEAAALLAVAEADVMQGEGPAARATQTRLDGARGQVAMVAADLPAKLELPVSVVTLGPVAWVHLPLEPFAAHALQLQAASPYPVTRLIGYTDGYFGYLVDAEAERNGFYEALITYFDTAATEHLLDQILALLHNQQDG